MLGCKEITEFGVVILLKTFIEAIPAGGFNTVAYNSRLQVKIALQERLHQQADHTHYLLLPILGNDLHKHLGVGDFTRTLLRLSLPDRVAAYIDLEGVQTYQKRRTTPSVRQLKQDSDVYIWR